MRELQRGRASSTPTCAGPPRSTGATPMSDASTAPAASCGGDRPRARSSTWARRRWPTRLLTRRAARRSPSRASRSTSRSARSCSLVQILEDGRRRSSCSSTTTPTSRRSPTRCSRHAAAHADRADRAARARRRQPRRRARQQRRLPAAATSSTPASPCSASTRRPSQAAGRASAAGVPDARRSSSARELAEQLRGRGHARPT